MSRKPTPAQQRAIQDLSNVIRDGWDGKAIICHKYNLGDLAATLYRITPDGKVTKV